MKRVNAVVVGAGLAGGIVAKQLSTAGLSVVLLERGQWVTASDCRKDDLRNQRTTVLGNGFGPEDEGNPRVVVYGNGKAILVLPSEGAYANNAACVGGGAVSYGAQAWRFMPQDFRMRSTYGAPPGSSLEDWPITYDDLEPFYDQAEYEIGISGDYSATPFHGPRRRPLPMPPLAPNREFEILEPAAKRLGLHPFHIPMARNSVAYNGRGPCMRCRWCCGFAFDIIGFNYNLKFPDDYHKANPTRPLYGSETSSAISTRGVYTTDPLRNTVGAYNSVVTWGETAEEWWTFYGTRDWEAGGFAWTGFDYRGEPTPYGWPSINSQFGIVDMCGFPKDTYYYYKAWWGKEPSLHLFPHWNFAGRDGEEIPVWVYSNLDEVELFVNGKSLGKQKVPHLGHVEWKATYEPGFIEARGSKGGKVVLTEKRETTGPAASIRLTADRTEINANGEDLAILKVEALDKEGRAVPTADNLIAFHISGAGTLLGVGNGDPNCQESDKEPQRSLFSGLAQVILQSTKQPGEIQVEATAEKGRTKLTSARLAIRTKAVEPRPAVG